MSAIDLLSAVLVLVGAGYFFAGTVGMLRFPDVYSRLHALTKGDNVGLGLTIVGLALQAPSLAVAGKLVLIWMLVLLGGATASHLIARASLRRGIKPWTAP
ncbi:MAG TPA: monovalent cation/H(+) antiporter subunit G [Gammaproteobacteria bacterium]|nr:monovalent cation/H(+) antiporter subunit G [Gammaproteobacteria bacterium]HRP87605.1 monovalent cation/H(+) antiporter subunit G [Gammaproteobacteria bacterium]